MADLISIVIPCYNEQEALPIFYKTAIPIFDKINVPYELIFVDDGSKDETAIIIKALANNDKRIRYILLSRNFGKESAMFAGLQASKGNYVAVMDADLQDPPEKVKEMYQTILEEKYDCVATRRVTRKGEPKIRSWFARKFYKIINKWSETEIVDGARDFRLMSRKMVNAILEMKEYNRFSKGIFNWVGFKTKWLEYENIQRCAGMTKWDFKKLFVYALDGIIAFSTVPLTFIIKLGLGLIGIDFLATLVMVILHFATKFVFASWIVLLVCMFFMTGIIICSLGILGLYQAKIYKEIKQRPIYISKEDNLTKK